jgi:hypothetical protein
VLTLRRWLAAILALAALRESSLASAEPARLVPCAGPVLRVSRDLSEEWSAALDPLRERLSSLPDVDRCAEVDLVPQASHVDVVIRLADGRVALRQVDSPAEAITAVEALLTTLPGRRPVGKEQDRTTEARDQPSKLDAAEAPKASVRVVAVDVGIGVSLHVAGHPWFLGYGFSGHVSVAINQWLLGSWLRWDIQDRLLEGEQPNGLVGSSFLLGAFTGRRFAIGRADLDLVVGPNLVIDTEEAAGPDTNDIGGELGSLSLGAALRLFVPRSGSPAFFALCGGDVIPSRLQRSVRADPSLPSLPPWSGTLVLGVAWGGL